MAGSDHSWHHFFALRQVFFVFDIPRNHEKTHLLSKLNVLSLEAFRTEYFIKCYPKKMIFVWSITAAAAAATNGPISPLSFGIDLYLAETFLTLWFVPKRLRSICSGWTEKSSHLVLWRRHPNTFRSGGSNPIFCRNKKVLSEKKRKSNF